MNRVRKREAIVVLVIENRWEAIYFNNLFKCGSENTNSLIITANWI